jgi:hypothetical protein
MADQKPVSPMLPKLKVWVLVSNANKGLYLSMELLAVFRKSVSCKTDLPVQPNLLFLL